MNPDPALDILQTLQTRISDIVRPWAERSPNQPALVESSGVWTYAQLAAAIPETQTWLREAGVRAGDRVMLIGENCRAFVAILLAAAGMDAWPVLVNARVAAREVDQIREHCGARRVFYTTAVSAQAREHAKRHGATVADAAGLGPIGISPLKESVAPESVDSNVTNNVAALIYTSGTTGLPKGVMLTHRNLLFVAATSAKIRSLTPADRMYGILPSSHAVGLSVVLLGTLISGATLYLTPRFDPSAALVTLEKEQLTLMLGAPAMFALLIEYAKSKGIESRKFPALRVISSSGAPLQMPLKSAAETFFGLTLFNGYGVTECSPNVCQMRLDEPRVDLSVGRIFPGMEAKLVGAYREPGDDAETGELWVRGPNVMKGYYRAQEETAAAIDAEGWFNTRDLARIEDGHVFIVGRTKELIVRFGFNVYPAEVESVLNAHPGVVRSGVIGRTAGGTQGGEEVVAFVQLQPDSNLATTDLAKYAAQNLAPYKVPSQFVIVANMPTTPTGKVAKAELAKMEIGSAKA